jgi:hypothetical protein
MDNATANKNVWIEQPCPSQTKRTYYYSDGTTLTKEGGTVAWRNNNEGNLRPGSLSSNRIGKDRKNFAVFATPEDGHEAKKYLLFSSSSYKDLTLKDAIKKYAPAGDNNNPVKYAANVMKDGNVENKVMHTYKSNEQGRIMDAMKIQEGYKPGKETWGTHSKSNDKQSKNNVDKKKVDYTKSAAKDAVHYDLNSAIAYNRKLAYSSTRWKTIQNKLNYFTNSKLDTDGIPGGLTADSIYKFQSNNSMDKLDGKLGPNTERILGI